MTGENMSKCLWYDEEGQFILAWYVKEWPLFLYPKAHLIWRKGLASSESIWRFHNQ